MSIMHTEMSNMQIEEFLQAPRHAIVGTNRKDGPPQLTPVWYLYEDGLIYVSVFVNSAKYRNLSRDPRISVCIAGDSPDARSVMMYGNAELTPSGVPETDEIEWRIVRRYCDNDEEAKEFLDSGDPQAAGALITITPKKIIAQDYN